MPEQNEQQEQWAIVELMGHAQTAGRVTRPSEWGGLMRVDVPTGDGEFRTEFYSMNAIYSVKFTSEEIARAYATPNERIYSYDTPIITRDQHEAVTSRYENEVSRLRRENHELQHRLTAINALPASTDADEDDKW